jgi:hypothetical protein
MDKLNLKGSKKSRFSKAIVPPAKGIGSSPANDNMIQQRDIHCCCRFSKLPRELYVRGAWTWVPTWMVVWSL